MKTTRLLLVLLVTPCLLFAQQKNTPKLSDDIHCQKNIYRLDFTFPMMPDYETKTLSGIWEHKISEAFTFHAKSGLGADIQKFGPSTRPYQFSFHFFSSVEGRYYFTLHKRIKKGKISTNFSSLYISLEQAVYTNPIALINQSYKNAFKGNTRTFFNLGYQKQIRDLHFGAFLGVVLFKKEFATYYEGHTFPWIHGGVMLGHVFNKRK